MTDWISVKERLPDTKGYYLCTYIFDNHRFYYDRFFDTEEKKFITTDKITHWMPIPELPPIKNFYIYFQENKILIGDSNARDDVVQCVGLIDGIVEYESHNRFPFKEPISNETLANLNCLLKFMLESIEKRGYKLVKKD